MAVISSPGGGFRWMYIYTNQKKAVFMDSHVRFFEMMGGCWREIVYDNMRKALFALIAQLEEILYAEKQYWDNIPINLQNGPAYQAAEQAVSAMEEAYELLYRAY